MCQGVSIETGFSPDVVTGEVERRNARHRELVRKVMTKTANPFAATAMRRRRSTTDGRVKITPEMVARIRAAWSRPDGPSQAELAQRYDICRQTVSRIVNGRGAYAGSFGHAD